MRRVLLAVVAAIATTVPTPARAQDACPPRAVIFTLVGTTWTDVERYRPRNVLTAVERGAAGSISVRTNSSRTSIASGFVTLGAGTRADGGLSTGGIADGGDPPADSGRDELRRNVRVAGLSELERLVAEATDDAVPGALGSALDDETLGAVGNGDPGFDPPTPLGFGRWALLAAMDEAGAVDLAAAGPDLLTSEPGAPFGVATDETTSAAVTKAILDDACAHAIVDHGDLARVDLLEQTRGESLPDARAAALGAADRLLGEVMDSLDPGRDLLLIVSPTSPAWDPTVHFGVAIAVGPGFDPGASLESPSTGRAGIVTLPDVAPTILEHLGIERPDPMLGRPWFPIDPPPTDRVAAAIALDDEATFVDRVRTPVSTAFVVFQIVVYGLILVRLLSMRDSDRGVFSGRAGGLLELAALAVVALPAATYLMGVVEQNELGVWGFPLALLGLTGGLVALVASILDDAMDRLLVLAGGTLVLLLVDGVTGGHLQLNTVFSYSPIVAGRFAGYGNIAYSVIAVTSVIAATLIVHRWGGSRRTLAAIGVLFVTTIAIDGAPQFGSDVGGIIALVPGLAFTWILLSGRRLSWKVVAASVAVMVGALGFFLAIDLSRPPESRTHLARLYEDVSARGLSVLGDAIVRKAETNLRVFTSTIWTYLVPPALAVIAWLFLRPRGRWSKLAITHPKLRAGMIAGLVLALIGFTVNDSGIVIPALMLSYLVPMALLIHLSLDRGRLRETPT